MASGDSRAAGRDTISQSLPQVATVSLSLPPCPPLQPAVRTSD